MEFKKIPMLHNLYEISADGKHFRRVSTGKELKISEGANYGYSSVVFTVNQRYPEEDILRTHEKAFECGVHKDGTPVHQLTLKVHQLVYNAWVGEVPENMVIDHIDRNRKNNSVENLRIVDKSFNAKNREEEVHLYGCRLYNEQKGEFLRFDTKVKAIDYVASLLGKSRRTVYNAFYGVGKYKQFKMLELGGVSDGDVEVELEALNKKVDSALSVLCVLCKEGKVNGVKEVLEALYGYTKNISVLRRKRG